MEFIIPYTKEIRFDSKIKEIASISLEHETNVNEYEILGNFIVSGEYKAHELSINKEKFSYTLPFNISISEELDHETINFEITDFSYELLDNNTLKVMIESKVSGEKKQIIEESAPELFEDVQDITDDLEIIQRTDTNINDEEIITDERKKESEEPIVVEESETKIEKEITEKTIINEEKYSTYLVHVISESETIETICQKYKITKSDLEEYNDISKISIGEKLLIPSNE